MVASRCLFWPCHNGSWSFWKGLSRSRLKLLDSRLLRWWWCLWWCGGDWAILCVSDLLPAKESLLMVLGLFRCVSESRRFGWKRSTERWETLSKTATSSRHLSEVVWVVVVFSSSHEAIKEAAKDIKKRNNTKIYVYGIHKNRLF